MATAVVLVSLFTSAHAARVVQRQAHVHASNFIPAHAVGPNMHIANKVRGIRPSLGATQPIDPASRWRPRLMPRSQLPTMAMQNEGADGRFFPDEDKAITDIEAEEPNVHSISKSTPDDSAPRLSRNDLNELDSKGYVIVENFLPADLQEALRKDVQSLRKNSKFNIAKIGQDSTNTLNTNIRVAETCFLGPNKLSDQPDAYRSQLYTILDQLRQDLPQPLDPNLSEFLYAYYPKGGFYRRHRDAIPGSASTLRKFSLLLYLNKDWNEEDGGRLRVHMDSGGDFLPQGEKPNFRDIDPLGGTLVLFESDKFPHEVLDSQKERMAIIGWYNRPVNANDIAELLGGDFVPVRLVGLAVAAGLVTVGLIMGLSG